MVHLLPNDQTQFNAIFTQMVAPIADVEENMYALNLHRGITRLGYKAELVFDNDSFSHIKMPAADHYYIEISPITDEDRITLPLMVYEEYPAVVQEHMNKTTGVNGSYRYQAHFTVKYDDYDPQRMHDLGLTEDDICGQAFIGLVEHSAYSFNEFVQGALYKILRSYDVEIYLNARTSPRKAF